MASFPTDISGLVVKSANLSDLTDAAMARTNIGLGSASDVTFKSITTTDPLLVDGVTVTTGTAAELASTIPDPGELIYVTDDQRLVSGDGTSTVAELMPGASTGGVQLLKGTAGINSGSFTGGTAGAVTGAALTGSKFFAVIQLGNGSSATSTSSGVNGATLSATPIRVRLANPGTNAGESMGGAAGSIAATLLEVVSGAGGNGGFSFGTSMPGGAGGSIGGINSLITFTGGRGGDGGPSSGGAGGGKGLAEFLKVVGGEGGITGSAAAGGVGGAISPTGSLTPTIEFRGGKGGAGGSATGAIGGAGGALGTWSFVGGEGGAGSTVAGAAGGAAGSFVMNGGNASGTTAGGAAGSLITSASGTLAGGSINTSAGTAAGGSINTSNGGGSINTRADGTSEFKGNLSVGGTFTASALTTSGGILYTSSTGVVGQYANFNFVNAGGYAQLTLLSGASNATPVIVLGRTSQDALFGIASSGDLLLSGAAAGDFVVRAYGTYRVGIGTTQVLSSSTTGTTVAGNLTAPGIVTGGSTGVYASGGAFYSANGSVVVMHSGDSRAMIQFKAGAGPFCYMGAKNDGDFVFYGPDGSTAAILINQTALTAATGDVEVATIAKGLILKSPNGTRYRVTVSNAGALVVTAV